MLQVLILTTHLGVSVSEGKTLLRNPRKASLIDGLKERGLGCWFFFFFLSELKFEVLKVFCDFLSFFLLGEDFQEGREVGLKGKGRQIYTNLMIEADKLYMQIVVLVLVNLIKYYFYINLWVKVLLLLTCSLITFT